MRSSRQKYAEWLDQTFAIELLRASKRGEALTGASRPHPLHPTACFHIHTFYKNAEDHVVNAGQQGAKQSKTSALQARFREDL